MKPGYVLEVLWGFGFTVTIGAGDRLSASWGPWIALAVASDLIPPSIGA